MMMACTWIRLGTKLILFLFLVSVFTGCIEVNVQCPSPNAMRGDDSLPTGCGKNPDGSCKSSRWCKCP